MTDRTLVLIPARGGSKRVPRKNVREFLGIPAVGRVVSTARAAGIGRVVVSTDDDEVASVARDHGAEVPFRRPPELSDDEATTVDVVRHAIGWFGRTGNAIDLVCVIYPTALLVDADVLVEARDSFTRSGAEFLLASLRYPHPIERALMTDDRGRLRPVDPRHALTRTQDLEGQVHDAGQFYFGSAAAWSRSGPMESDNTVQFALRQDQAVDIDTEEDWAFAELIARARGLESTLEPRDPR